MGSIRIHHCQSPTASVSVGCGLRNKKGGQEAGKKMVLSFLAAPPTRFLTPQGVNFHGFVRSPRALKETSARLFRDPVDCTLDRCACS